MRILSSPEKHFLIYSTNQLHWHMAAKRLKESLRKVDSLSLWEKNNGHNPWRQAWQPYCCRQLQLCCQNCRATWTHWSILHWRFSHKAIQTNTVELDWLVAMLRAIKQEANGLWWQVVDITSKLTQTAETGGPMWDWAGWRKTWKKCCWSSRHELAVVHHFIERPCFQIKIAYWLYKNITKGNANHSFSLKVKLLWL